MRSYALFLLFGAIFLAGCGGGGGTGSPPSETGSTGGESVVPRSGTATFRVNVETGDVSITPLTPESRAVFAGNAIKFQSSTLVDKPGDVGRKVVNVSLKNNAGEPIGLLPNGTPTGVRVLFTDFANVTTSGDYRLLTRADTIAGSTVIGSDDGPAFAARFKRPGGLAVGADGSVIIADTDNHRLRKLKDAQVWTLAGSGAPTSTDGSGTAATFNRPFAIAAAQDGSFFVCEAAGSVIRRVTADGLVKTVAGTGVVGSADGPGDMATFNKPEGIAIGQDGRIYVSDTANNKIRVITPPITPGPASTYMVSTLAGSGAAAFADGIGASASFKSPRGVTVAQDGNVYVADRLNQRIRRISPGGEVITISGTGASSHVDGIGDNAQYNQPSGILAISNTALITSEATNNVLRQITLYPGATPASPKSWLASTICGNVATPGYADGSGGTALFNTPGNLAFLDGTVLIADIQNSVLRRMTADSGLPVPLEGNASNDKPRLSNPDGLTPGGMQYMDFEGALQPNAISDTKLWAFDIPEGVKVFTFTVSVEATTEAPTTLVGVSNIDATGVGSPNNMVRTFAGGVPAYVDGPLSAARFNTAFDIAQAADGTLFVTDYPYMIRRISTDGVVSTVAGSGPGSTDGAGNSALFNGVQSLVCSPSGDVLYVCDRFNNEIRRVQLVGSDPSKSSNWNVTTIAGLVGSPGDADGNGSLARFREPRGIALIGESTLYVAEIAGSRIRKVTFNGGNPAANTSWNISLFAGSATAVAGSTNANGSLARFSLPLSIESDGAGTLYVADYGNRRIRALTLNADVTTFAGSSNGHADGLGTAAKFTSCQSIAITPGGYMYIGEDGYIRRISPAGVVTTVAGRNAFGDVDGPGNAAIFQQVYGVCVTPSGDLLATSGTKIKLVQRVLSN